ncbi:MAG: helix-turn-helix transcriptional regulator [Polaribacter sp.]|nr:helix-turn-helix transcriptional regulator [Polaribacter sp.]
MINGIEFTTRIKKVMEFYDLSASLFADKIGVQRSSISHILSGRNKPSLDFVLKITSEFKEVDIHWLLEGKGVFPKTEQKESPTSTPTLFSSNSNDGKQIQRIVVFYVDGTFEEYQK